MLTKKRISHLGKRLAQLSFNADGVLDRDRVAAILEAMGELHERNRNALGRKYYYFLEAEWNSRLLKIEHVVGCDWEGIRTLMERFTQKKLQCELVKTPELIAGLRVTLGDHIWERSIRNDLWCISRN
ncbi:MAG: hypothetical protein LBN94_01895 [Puniceicoccales bacterium]|jgi:hypothetical protein|nr:hypothetical protein [Puniceicoccales bacterium]